MPSRVLKASSSYSPTELTLNELFSKIKGRTFQDNRTSIKRGCADFDVFLHQVHSLVGIYPHFYAADFMIKVVKGQMTFNLTLARVCSI